MSAIVTERTDLSASLTPATGAPVVLLATDGTAQSEPAVTFVRELSARRAIDVHAGDTEM